MPVAILLLAWLLAALTPTQRSQRARIAALTRWSREAPAVNAARGQAGLMAKFVDQVDPGRQLPEAERQRRAEAARRAHMQRLAFRSAKARGKRSASDGGGPRAA
jgi:hypothetical protein